MIWSVFLSAEALVPRDSLAIAGVVTGVAICGLLFWWVFYGGVYNK